jgi:hypothetical protein
MIGPHDHTARTIIRKQGSGIKWIGGCERIEIAAANVKRVASSRTSRDPKRREVVLGQWGTSRRPGVVRLGRWRLLLLGWTRSGGVRIRLLSIAFLAQARDEVLENLELELRYEISDTVGGDEAMDEGLGRRLVEVMRIE